MRHHAIDEFEHPDLTDGVRPSRWSSLRPGRSLLLFPVAVALCWAIVIAAFTSIGRLWGPEGEQGTWGDVVAAAVGNFAFVFVAALAASVVMRFVRSRPR